jgi:hypothetical protein
MKYLPLLGESLKSDEIIDLLELHDVDVIYDFDRLHENIPDQYWATCHTLGIQINFDQNQILKTIFIYLIPADGFTPADISDSDILTFDSKQKIRDYALENNIEFTEGQTSFFGEEHDWIRFDYPDHKIHYDFGGGSLKKISLSSI